MIVVDIGDNGDHRLQVQKGGVALVGLGDQIAARAQARVAVGALQAPTDDKGGIEPGFRQHARHQARGRRLSMRARHGNRVAKAHQLAQHFRARHHRNALGQRLGDFGIGAIDRARHHDHVRVAQVLGVVADENLHAQARKALRDRVALEVGALHFVAQVQQHFGDPTHAAAADADQVNSLDATHPIFQARAHRHAAAPAAMHRSARRVAASVMRVARAASAILSNAARSALSSAMTALKVSGVRSRS